MRTTTITLSSTTLLLLSACAYDPDSSADEDVLARLDALEASYETLDTEKDELSARVLALEDDNAILTSRVEELELQSSTLTQQVLDLESAIDTELADDAIRLLTEDVTYTVSSADELRAALTDLDHYRIGSGTTANIELAAGDYEFTSPIDIEHPDGARIRIYGATGEPGDVTLSFSGSKGIRVTNGQALGYLGELTLVGDGSGNSGLLVTYGSVARLGKLEIEDFGARCVYALNSSTIAPEDDGESRAGWLTTSGCYYGIAASGSSSIDAQYVATSGNTYGLYASHTSRIYAPDVTSTNDDKSWAARGYSLVWAENGTSAADTTHLWTDVNGLLYVGGATYGGSADLAHYGSSTTSWTEWYVE